jgi:hypothetical protein
MMSEEEVAMMPEREVVMEDGVMLTEGEVVATEGQTVMHHAPMMHAHSDAPMMHSHSDAPMMHAHTAMNGQGAGRRSSAQRCNRSQCDDELSDHRVPPFDAKLVRPIPRRFLNPRITKETRTFGTSRSRMARIDSQSIREIGFRLGLSINC